MRRNKLTPVTGCHRPNMGWCARLSSHVSILPQCHPDFADTEYSRPGAFCHLIMLCSKCIPAETFPLCSWHGLQLRHN